MEYYDSRDEFKFVGIIDKEINRKKNKRINEMKDVFKIREERAKILDKKRGTGIPSLKGAVCATSKQKEYLESIANEVGLKVKKDETRSELCSRIRDKFLELEKYSTGKNKITYIMIPTNHPSLPFPYNLDDRVQYIQDKLGEQIKFKIHMSVNKKDKKYIIKIKDEIKLKDFHDLFNQLGGKLEKDRWIFNIE
jgi:vacuolar-type H+-ATPase catalytic subunit A/Vma1